MKTRTKENLVFISIYSLLVFSALGAMVGTYAWFEYSSRVSNQFHGTAVNRSGDLKVGIYSENELPNYAEHGLEKDGNNYWATEGLSAETLSYFLHASGYASNTLFPVTTGSYAENGNFRLLSNPLFMDNNINKPAKKTEYIYLPLIFAVNGGRSSTNDIDIRLREADIESTNQLKEAIRLHFDTGDTNFTFAPSESRDGQDIVGGTLDLNLDGYIDYDETTNREYIYGEVDNVSYKTTPNQGETILPKKERNCFNGKHHEGSYSLNDDVVYKTSQYLGKNSVLSTKNIVASTLEGIARVNLTIYAEGWANSLIDEVVGTGFNLDLTFEINH